MRLKLFLALAISAPLWAEPQHMLDYVLPRGGTVGTTVDVTLRGRYLQDPREIVFYDNGIKAIDIK